METKKKMRRDQLIAAIRQRLKALSYEYATSVEQALEYEQIVCDTFNIPPSKPGSYDMCPVHTTVVRFKGQCQACMNRAKRNGE